MKLEDTIVSVKEYKNQKRDEYTTYLHKCVDNNVEPEPMQRYFPIPKINYGYILPTANGYEWRKRKRDLINLIS